MFGSLTSRSENDPAVDSLIFHEKEKEELSLLNQPLRCHLKFSEMWKLYMYMNPP